jgi:hypothetical protein
VKSVSIGEDADLPRPCDRENPEGRIDAVELEAWIYN